MSEDKKFSEFLLVPSGGEMRVAGLKKIDDKLVNTISEQEVYLLEKSELELIKTELNTASLDIVSLKSDAENASNDIENLKSADINLTTELDNAKVRIGVLEVDVDALETELLNLSSWAEDTDADMATFEDSLIATAAEVDAVEVRTTSVEEGVSALDTRVTSLEGDLGTLSGRTSSLESSTSTNTSDINSLKASVGNYHFNKVGPSADFGDTFITLHNYNTPNTPAGVYEIKYAGTYNTSRVNGYVLIEVSSTTGAVPTTTFALAASPAAGVARSFTYAAPVVINNAGPINLTVKVRTSNANDVGKVNISTITAEKKGL